MKKVLITGESSYVGNAFEKWINVNYSNEIIVCSIGVRNGNWQNISFEGYDVVLHVAGIAHVSKNKKLASLYYDINTNLTEKIAKKAKKEGVTQFIFMSSIIVYGNQNRKIDINTLPSPNDFYGDSKLEAEKILLSLETDHFKIAIVRSPMIYGKGSKGNFPKLVYISKLIPIFPEVSNQRSMLYIDNLTEFLKNIVINNDSGTFFPQNSEYSNTTDLVKLISEFSGKSIVTTKMFNWIINKYSNKGVLNKLFGSLVYEKEMSFIENNNYHLIEFRDSIKYTVNNNED